MVLANDDDGKSRPTASSRGLRVKDDDGKSRPTASSRGLRVKDDDGKSRPTASSRRLRVDPMRQSVAGSPAVCLSTCHS